MERCLISVISVYVSQTYRIDYTCELKNIQHIWKKYQQQHAMELSTNWYKKLLSFGSMKNTVKNSLALADMWHNFMYLYEFFVYWLVAVNLS